MRSDSPFHLHVLLHIPQWPPLHQALTLEVSYTSLYESRLHQRKKNKKVYTKKRQNDQEETVDSMQEIHCQIIFLSKLTPTLLFAHMKIDPEPTDGVRLEGKALALLMAFSRGWRIQISLQRHRSFHRGCTGAAEAPQECWWDLGWVTELTHRALHYISKGVSADGGKTPQLYLPPTSSEFYKKGAWLRCTLVTT